VSKTKIEWTEQTWNPVTGCTPVSAGCDHCYARRMAKRLQKMQPVRYAKGFTLTLHTDLLEAPLRWKKPHMVFVCSMGDLFHEDVADEFIESVFEIMWNASRHTYQILTKRPKRMATVVKWLMAPALVPETMLSNIWLGTSVENADHRDRVDHLRKCPAAVRFLSVEPMLGAIPTLDLTGIHWVIVGGESGPGARPMHPDWARSIRDQCGAAGVPFFFKQWGAWMPAVDITDGTGLYYRVPVPDGAHHMFEDGVKMCRPRGGKKATGRVLDGRTWDETPATAKRKDS
jgi:protein gp37